MFKKKSVSKKKSCFKGSKEKSVLKEKSVSKREVRFNRVLQDCFEREGGCRKKT